MRAARKDFTPPRDLRTPEALRPVTSQSASERSPMEHSEPDGTRWVILPVVLAGRAGSPYSPGLMQGAARETVFRHRHLLGIEGLSPEDIKHVLDLADGYVELNRQAEKKRALLRGRTIINCFFENSTRTRTSFEVAGKRLGGDVINMSVAASSMHKGETLIDTAMTLNAMHPDVLIVRHPESGAVQLLSEKLDCAVINAGDGSHEHPTQALLDALDDPPAQGPARRAHRRDLRRRPAQPRRALEHRAA